MKQRNELRTQPDQPVSLAKPILFSAVIGLMLISFFLFKVGKPDPGWGKIWIIKPLIIVPFAGQQEVHFIIL